MKGFLVGCDVATDSAGVFLGLGGGLFLVCLCLWGGGDKQGRQLAQCWGAADEKWHLCHLRDEPLLEQASKQKQTLFYRVYLGKFKKKRKKKKKNVFLAPVLTRVVTRTKIVLAKLQKAKRSERSERSFRGSRPGVQGPT